MCPIDFISGYYIYTEASNNYNKEAKLRSPPVSGNRCLVFYYHMKVTGSHSLTVSVLGDGEKVARLVWSLRGNQQDVWKKAQVPIITQNTKYQVRIITLSTIQSTCYKTS